MLASVGTDTDVDTKGGGILLVPSAELRYATRFAICVCCSASSFVT